VSRIIGRAALVLLGAAVVTIIWMVWPERADVEGISPPEGRYEVVIRRDSWGVPHVHGRTDADAAYGLAWAHAEDDFATIQDTLLAVSGSAAAHVGRDAVGIDYLLALLRVREDVDAGWDGLSPEVRALCDAYADGINHYASANPDEAVPGIWPVTGRDVVAGFLYRAPLFFGLDQVLGALFTEEERPDLTAWEAPAARWGSNVLAVSPRRSSDGATLLAANSHQPWTGPVAWYEAHVSSDEGWNMTGGLFPGMPVLALGHNADLGWSFTVNRPDLIDVYVLDVDPADPDRYRVDGEWLELEVREVPIRVQVFGRLRITARREALWSIFGPVVRRDHGTYAVRYAGMGMVGMVEQLYRMNRATSFEEWQAALAAQSGLPSLNIGYADRTGRIAYVHHGLFPDRAEGYDWSGYLPGDTTDTLWDGYLPLESLPWVVDPESGFVQNANSTPYTAAGEGTLEPGGFPASMGIPDTETNRSLRALELLEADGAITFDEFRAIKYDVGYHPMSLPARLAGIIAGFAFPDDPDLGRAVEVVRGWEREAGTGDRATALVVTTLALLLEDGGEIDPSQLVAAPTPPVEAVERAFRLAVRALLETTGRVDPAWEEVNRLVRGDLDLGLAGGPDLLHAVYGEPSPGRFEGIAGDTYLLFARWDASGRVESWSIHQFGTATLDRTSPHYSDQAPLFARRELKPVWFLETDVLADTVRAYAPGDGR
jgi:acyl-homoserine-lactone acylase